MDEELTIEQVDDVLVLSGELDVATAPEVTAAIAQRSGVVVLDLSGITFVDSSGLRALLAAQRDAKESGTRFVLRQPSAAMHRLLEMTGTAESFVIE